MKHAVKGKQLNRDIQSRRALFKNLILSLIEHGQIKTTEAKAKAVRASFEKLITKAKVGSLAHRRLVDEVLNQRSAVNRLVDEIAPAVKRTGGYTRIVKLGTRRGDAAAMVRLEIIDWQPKAPVAPSTKKAAKAKPEAKPEIDTKPVEAARITKTDEKITSKVKRPTPASAQAKHIPQKRIGGGGK